MQLKKQMEEKELELTLLEKKSINLIWMEDLDEFLKVNMNFR